MFGSGFSDGCKVPTNGVRSQGTGGKTSVIEGKISDTVGCRRDVQRIEF